ncbi:MAG: phosphocarrier protein HPr [Coxiella sp. RIFCSPHIGHO2_12_FULL_44_14]|nr:MAG: phosphocarrier protein HPr [Coxiella sp. RIFCSPHIGHO2_12_FULL_44_14]
MQQKRLTIINKLGLHARAAVKLVNTASRFSSEIIIRHNGREINAKSVMNVMVMAASQGSIIELVISGEDEVQAMAALEKLINNRFGEEE